MKDCCPEGWDIFTIVYKMPVFGSDDSTKTNYGPDMVMMVSTQGGKRDAELACKQYHKNCKIVSILSRKEGESK